MLRLTNTNALQPVKHPKNIQNWSNFYEMNPFK